MPRILAVVVLCLIAFPAHAMPCWMIKQYVAAYGEAAAVEWAKSHGYSDKEIALAKRCLK
jgi:hypothetical protein